MNKGSSMESVEAPQPSSKSGLPFEELYKLKGVVRSIAVVERCFVVLFVVFTNRILTYSYSSTLTLSFYSWGLAPFRRSARVIIVSTRKLPMP
jgi:hypothetical protein